MQLRNISSADYNDLLHLAMEYCKEVGFNTDSVTLNKYVQWILTTKSIVAVSNDKAVGIISYIVYPHHLTNELCGKKIAWFVLKEHRGIGAKLLYKAEQAVKELGAKRFYCATPTKMPKAYTSIETDYVKEL